MSDSQISTRLIHHPYRAPAGFDAPALAVYKASTVFFPNVAAMLGRDWKHKTGYTYGLHGTPTTFELEERIATLEGGLQALLVPSGLCAIALINLALLKHGDEVLIPSNGYGPGLAMAKAELSNFGINHRIYDPMNLNSLEKVIGATTRLVWLEAAGSLTMEFPDVLAIAAICRQRGVLTSLDNTWGAGLAFNPFNLEGSGSGVDISMHALTKYPSGGGDVLMGSVVTRDEALHQRLKSTHMRMGLGVGANDVELILRSLPSIELRYAAQDAKARQLAHGLADRSEIAAVLHPALKGSPGHDHWRKLCGDRGSAAGIFSVVFHDRYDVARIHQFCDALRLFRIGYSWAGPVSLVMPYDIAAIRSLDVAPWNHKGNLVRFAIGLESVDDLARDLEQALATLAPVG